jgi:hypothetical protein
MQVVGAAVAGGLVIVLGGTAAYVRLRPPSIAFADQWDSNVAATAPAVFPIAKADPALRTLMLDKTQAAYMQGGWSAASTVFYRIVHARIEAYASDDTTLACAAAWRNVYRDLLATPHLCRVLIADGPGALPPHTAEAGIQRAQEICDAAIMDSGQNRLAPSPPTHMSREEYDAAWIRALDWPAKLTQVQRASLVDPAPADEAAYCQGVVTHGENIAALPAAEAARYVRQEYAREDSDFDYEPPPDLARAAPPPDYTCAAPGTRFTLSMESSSDGRPIVWESLGRRGWDCELRSSASGVRGSWGASDRDNAMRLLWPLRVGKTATCICGGAAGGTAGAPGRRYKVAGFGRYWLPFGTVQAYAIEQRAIGADGATDYKVTKFWAPSLGFLIGQRTEVLRGKWPQGVAPDWQVIALQPPSPS